MGAAGEAEVVGRQVGIPVAVAIAVLTGLGTVVGLLLDGALASTVGRLDEELVDEVVGARTATLDAVTGATTWVAEVVTVAVLWAAAVAVAAWRTRSWVLPVFLVAAVGGEKLTYLATSTLVGRSRPDLEALGHVYGTGSFPSGHVGSTITLYGGVAVAVLWHRARTGGGPPPRGLVAAIGVLVAVLAAAVGASRVYRGHHFPTDVAWGAVLGLVWLRFASRVVLGPAGGVTPPGSRRTSR